MSSRGYALLLAGLFFAVGVLYISFSGIVARAMSADMTQLWWIETLKGYVFMAVIAVFLYGFSYSLFKRVQSKSDRLLESRQALMDAERRATAGLVAASIAHDCNNICTILRLSTEQLKVLADMPPRSQDVLRRLDHGVTQLTELTKGMRQIGRHIFAEQPREFDVDSAIRDALQFVRMHEEVRHCDINYDGNAHLPVKGNPVLIHQVVMNLVLNAAQATAGQGRIDVVTRPSDLGLELEVHDNGPGVAPDQRGMLFKALRTTKPDGAGLGLMSVKSAAELYGGRVQVETSPLGGACFRVVFPMLSRNDSSPGLVH